MKDNRPVFTDRKGAMITRNNYGKQLASLFRERFGKNVTSSLIRSIFLTEQFKDLPRLKDLMKTSNSMMHGLKTQITKYVKK